MINSSTNTISRMKIFNNLNKVTYSLGIFLIILLYFSGLANANPQTGKVDYPTLGISFMIPNGWLGRETEQGFMMGSNDEAGLILLSTHNYKSLDAMKQQASAGITDGVSMHLRFNGQFEQLSKTAVGAEFNGILEGQKVQAYIAGVINPYGMGVSIMALTSAQQFSPRHVELTKQIVSSLVFAKPKTGPIVGEWQKSLQGAKLTYLNSYYSSGPSYGGYMTGGGYSSEVVIRLCQNGRFTDSRNSSMSVDTGGAFANGADSNAGMGAWKVTGNVSGGASLQLSYNDGSVSEYALEYKNKKTLLNGTRYFRTYDAGC